MEKQRYWLIEDPSIFRNSKLRAFSFKTTAKEQKEIELKPISVLSETSSQNLNMVDNLYINSIIYFLHEDLKLI